MQPLGNATARRELPQKSWPDWARCIGRRWASTPPSAPSSIRSAPPKAFHCDPLTRV